MGFILGLVVIFIIVKVIKKLKGKYTYTTVYARYDGISKNTHTYGGSGTSVTLTPTANGGYSGSIYRDLGGSYETYHVWFSYKNNMECLYHSKDSFMGEKYLNHYFNGSDISFSCGEKRPSMNANKGDIGILKYNKDNKFTFTKIDDQTEAKKLWHEQINKISAESDAKFEKKYGKKWEKK